VQNTFYEAECESNVFCTVPGKSVVGGCEWVWVGRMSVNKYDLHVVCIGVVQLGVAQKIFCIMAS